jgi:ppGpp synthetase/RelA/SpoT-type nucleotidyltranferase
LIVRSNVQTSVEDIRDQCVASLRAALRGLPQEGPSVTVESRIKSAESIRHKLERNKTRGADHLRPRVNDYLGFRVIIPHLGLLEHAVGVVERWVQDSGVFSLLLSSDYFSRPQDSLYRSVHMDLAFKPAEHTVLDQSVGAEIQITTYLQHYHSALSHQVGYLSGKFEPPNKDVAMLLRRIAVDLSRIDEDVGKMFAKSRSFRHDAES